MKQFRRIIYLRVLLMLLSLTGIAWLLFRQEYYYALLLSPVGIWTIWSTVRSQLRTYKELQEFAEAARYRDFTRFFTLEKARVEVRPLRAAFNDVNLVFKQITSERETQYQYLQKILEMVDTAILSYEENTGKVMWINESFKRLFQIPYFTRLASLKKRNNKLYQQILTLEAGDEGLFQFETAKGTLKLQMHVSGFQTGEGRYILVAVQNIDKVLDETEAKAWQKLLSVLTHEIMNSIAPISSLADTLQKELEKMPATEELADIRLGMHTIKRRSDGLLSFAGTYRSLNKITEPNLSTIHAADLFENIYVLLEPTLLQKQIELDIIITPSTDLAFQLDINLIEQVLINLLLNAIEAVKDTPVPYISLKAHEGQDGKWIQVRDNGKGMGKDILEHIFTPFFTTRKSGSGVGLTLSKQIMLLHKGNIQVHSEPEKGSSFTLQFPQES